jgi:hypothetical protein
MLRISHAPSRLRSIAIYAEEAYIEPGTIQTRGTSEAVLSIPSEYDEQQRERKPFHNTRAFQSALCWLVNQLGEHKSRFSKSLSAPMEGGALNDDSQFVYGTIIPHVFFPTTCFGPMGAIFGYVGVYTITFCFLLLSPHWPAFTHWGCVVCMFFVCPFFFVKYIVYWGI